MSTKSRWRSALVEGLVIVASILAAFAIDAWWDGLQEEAARIEVLSGLRSGFLATRDLLSVALERGDVVMNRNQAVLMVSSGAAAIPADSLRSMLADAVNTVGFTPAISNYQAAVASGAIASLRSDSLLVLLNRFDRGLNRHEQHMQLSGQMFYLGPLQTQLAEIGGMRALRETDDVVRVVRRPAFRAAVETFRTVQQNLVASLRQMDEATRAILVELDDLLAAN